MVKNRTILPQLLGTRPLDAERFTVLDIGSRAGDPGRWKAFGPNLRYYGFEPDEQECARLNAACAAPGGAPWEEQHFPIALAEADGERAFYVTREAGCSSLMEPNHAALDGFVIADNLTVESRDRIRTSSLSTWAQANGVRQVDFIKLDVQGAELEIMRGGETVLAGASGLEVEVEFIELYKGQPLFAELDTWLRSKGFVLFDISKVFSKRTTIAANVLSRGQLTWGDALYLRDVRSLADDRHGAAFSAARLMKLAAVADLYGRPDFALYVLQTAAREFPERLLDELETVERILSRAGVPTGSPAPRPRRTAGPVAAAVAGSPLEPVLKMLRRRLGWLIRRKRAHYWREKEL